MVEIREQEIKEILPEKGPSFKEVKKYLQKYYGEYVVIKCGGSILEKENLLNDFIKDISILYKIGLVPILVHGGGKRISNELKVNGIESSFINGLRVTDEKSINIVEKVLTSFNKEITTVLIKNKCRCVSINNGENNIISVVQENEKLGYVGIPTKIDRSVIDNILKEKKVPVISPLGLDKNNKVYNINADTAAGAIAKTINARRLIIISDVEGVLDSDNKLFSELNTEKIDQLINNKTITGGMIPKIENCLDVAKNGVKGVVIIDGRKKHSVLFELLSDKGSGTLIRK
tara:strand:- start:606 stop:1472 length:867 start_codon:yes stop_codon:yes gene_type:complete